MSELRLEPLERLPPLQSLDTALRELRLTLEVLGQMKAPERDEARMRIVGLMALLVQTFTTVRVVSTPEEPKP